MRSISGASRHYREDMPSAGHLDLADLHSLAHPGVRSGLPGFGGHRGDRSIDAMQQGLAAMLPQTGAMRNPGFGASSHFLGASASSPDDNGYSAQNPTPHHPADYMMRGKPSHNPYYRGLSSHGHGKPCALPPPRLSYFACFSAPALRPARCLQLKPCAICQWWLAPMQARVERDHRHMHNFGAACASNVCTHARVLCVSPCSPHPRQRRLPAGR